ncbi:hypothetical protein OG21DRAFT_1494683 [Imleria badia]|nr:hypothetical protein OG21DRAFT_1494683 [Imleria badia]
MPRKKARSTQKKKIDKKIDKATPDGLSERQFAALSHDYGSFIVEDSEHEQHVFSLGDVAYIKHQDSEDSGEVIKDNHWIGKIQQIRGESSDNVWIHVQWFWSPHEVAEVIKSFDPTICGKYEKLISNNFDFVTVHCVVDHVEVKNFEETDIHQCFIGDEEWFSRFEFSYDGRRIKPKAAHFACPICKIPYIPGVEKIHHFCPRPNCRKFYHQSCLLKHGYVEKARNHRVLETWPDIDRTESVEELSSSFHPRKKQKRNCSASSARDPLADIPAELIAVAEQPIVRGTQGGGVVGNIASVVAARRLIYKALIGDSDIPDNWKTSMDTSTAFLDSDSLPNCFCPSCRSPI